MKNNILAVDLGTTSCKIAIFDKNLNRIAEHSLSYETTYRQPSWADQNPDCWWAAVSQGIQTVFNSSGITEESIACIGIDTMGSALVSVDKGGKVLYPAMLWMDRRSDVEAQYIQDLMSEELWRVNGNRSDPSNTAPKILWLKKNHPEVYNQTDCFLHANGFLVYRLTGILSMDKTECGLTQLCDTEKAAWDNSLFSLCGIDRKKVPDIYDCHEIVGTVTDTASEQTGLPSGIPVIAGSMDMCAAALGSGVYKPGQVYISAGTVTAMGACLDRADFHPDLHIYSHVVPGLYITAAGVDYGGAGLKWFKELLDLKDFSDIDESVAAAEEHLPLLFLPYMVGQRAPLWNSCMSGAIAGLHPSATRADLYRMLMRGNAFGIRRILNILLSSGHAIEQVRMTGGCSRSVPWMRIFADCTNLPYHVPGSSDVAVLGSAAMAAVGCGFQKDYDSIFNNRSVQASYLPDEQIVRNMDCLYKIYDDFLNAMLPVMDSLADLRVDMNI